jgi:diaminopimelate decarboxylase
MTLTRLPQTAEKVAQTYGTPAYVYDANTLRNSALRAKAFPNAFGLTVRYAMKASPNAAILKVCEGCKPCQMPPAD